MQSVDPTGAGAPTPAQRAKSQAVVAAAREALAEPPSALRRVMAMAALGGSVLLVVLVVATLVRTPALLLLGVIGVAVSAMGVWWVITERMPRRAVGVAVAVLGGGLLLATAVVAAREVGLGFLVLPTGLILAGLTTAATRVALAPDLHASDRVRAARTWRPQRPVLIANPASGGGKFEQFGLAAEADRLGVRVVVLGRGDDLAQLAHEAVDAGADCLGMAGGDGSQALVASVAIARGVPFVCISAGTRNHFAQDLGLDKDDPRAGMLAFRQGVPRRIDYATVGDRLFVNNASLGVYAEAVRKEGYREAKLQTAAELLPGVLGRDARSFDLSFEAPGVGTVRGALMVLVSNNPYQFSTVADVHRQALDTGRLGVLAVTAVSGVEAAELAALTALGLGRHHPGLHEFSATEFVVTSSQATIPAGIDGESVELATPLVFRIHPGGLKMLVPPEGLLAAEYRKHRGFRLSDLLAVAAGRAAISADPAARPRRSATARGRDSE